MEWTAEDTLVAVSHDRTKILAFDIKTQKRSDLVPGPIPGGVINWTYSPDYKYLYYTTGGAEPQALRVRLADHKVGSDHQLERPEPCDRNDIQHPNRGCARRLRSPHPQHRGAGNLRAHRRLAVTTIHRGRRAEREDKLRVRIHRARCPFRCERLVIHWGRGEGRATGSVIT